MVIECELCLRPAVVSLNNIGEALPVALCLSHAEEYLKELRYKADEFAIEFVANYNE